MPSNWANSPISSSMKSFKIVRMATSGPAIRSSQRKAITVIQDIPRVAAPYIIVKHLLRWLFLEFILSLCVSMLFLIHKGWL